MSEISASTVAKLREMTNAGLMDCKKALAEAGGNLDAAVDILRKKGAASAAKKAGREAKEGVIAQFIAADGKAGALIEVNCETDFVARNETFRAFCDALARKVTENPTVDLESDRTAQVSKIGENIKISRHQRFELQGAGALASYIHTGAKVGVLIEVGTGNPATAQKDEFKQLIRDLTLQIAAASPTVVSREQVEQSVLEKEKEIASEQFKGKPAQAIAKIVEGKMEKFYQTYCLVDQGFVKRSSEVAVKEQIAEVAKQVGDTITIRRFLRFQVGEAIAG